MPGTIQVTVLEFKGASSSSQPSVKYLKVSMGKRCYQTWDKGDFIFPITKLGEDLVVTMLDAGGNDIAHSAIRTMQIIEKGYWDEVFSLDGKGGGGGHVHMKLQFILSEEERKRIRLMRETAIKKKHETVANANTGPAESANAVEQKISDSQKGFVQIALVRHKVEAASQDTSPLNSAGTSSEDSVPIENERSTVSSAIPNATDGYHRIYKRVPAEKIETRLPFSNTKSNTDVWASSVLSGSAVHNKNETFVSKLKDDPVLESQKQNPTKRTPSNVRKMISAFENTQLQGMIKWDSKIEGIKSLKKASSVPSQLNRFGKAGILDVRKPDTSKQLSQRSLQSDEDQFLAENTRQTTSGVSGRSEVLPRKFEFPSDWKELEPSVALRETSVKGSESSTVDLIRQYSSETASSSGKMREKQSGVLKAEKFPLRLLDSSGSWLIEGRDRGTETELNSLTNADIHEVDSKQKQTSLEYYKEEYYSSESSGMWIFPDNTRRLCITTAGTRVMRPWGRQHVGAKTRQEKKNFSEAQKIEKHNIIRGGKDQAEKAQSNFKNPQEPASSSSPDDSSNGLVGQVIKIVAIVGFGVLVFLTRQKEPRKKKDSEGKANLSLIQISLT